MTFLQGYYSVQFSRPVKSDSLGPHGQQHTRLPCSSLTPGACSNSCPWSRWCLPTISYSVIPFSSRLQSFPASGSFQMSQFFASGDQSIGVSALASVLPINIQDWSPLGWTGWISLQSKGLSRVFFNTTVQKHQFFGALLSLYLPLYLVILCVFFKNKDILLHNLSSYQLQKTWVQYLKSQYKILNLSRIQYSEYNTFIQHKYRVN